MLKMYIVFSIFSLWGIWGVILLSRMYFLVYLLYFTVILLLMLYIFAKRPFPDRSCWVHMCWRIELQQSLLRVLQSRGVSCFSKHIFREHWVIETTVRGVSHISASSRTDLLLCEVLTDWNLLFTVDSRKRSYFKVQCQCLGVTLLNLISNLLRGEEYWDWETGKWKMKCYMWNIVSYWDKISQISVSPYWLKKCSTFIVLHVFWLIHFADLLKQNNLLLHLYNNPLYKFQNGTLVLIVSYTRLPLFTSSSPTMLHYTKLIWGQCFILSSTLFNTWGACSATRPHLLLRHGKASPMWPPVYPLILLYNYKYQSPQTSEQSPSKYTGGWRWVVAEIRLGGLSASSSVPLSETKDT